MKFRVDGRMYEFSQESGLTVKEAMQIKSATGQSIKAWFDGLEEMDPFSLAALVMVVKLRDGEKGPEDGPLRFDDIDFNIVEFAVEGEEEQDAADPTEPGGETTGVPPSISPPSNDA